MPSEKHTHTFVHVAGPEYIACSYCKALSDLQAAEERAERLHEAASAEATAGRYQMKRADEAEARIATLEGAAQPLVDEIEQYKVINWPKLKRLRDDLREALAPTPRVTGPSAHIRVEGNIVAATPQPSEECPQCHRPMNEARICRELGCPREARYWSAQPSEGEE